MTPTWNVNIDEDARMWPYDYSLRNPLTYSFRFLKQLPAGILFKSVDLYRRQCTDSYTVVCDEASGSRETSGNSHSDKNVMQLSTDYY